MSAPPDPPDGPAAAEDSPAPCEAPAPPPKPPRTIFAFLGGGEPRASPTPTNTAKRRRKNPEQGEAGSKQGRIVLNVDGGQPWTVGRRQEEEGGSEGGGSVAGGKGKGKANGGGEEEELREMNKKSKATKAPTKGKRGKKSKEKDESGGQPGQLALRAGADDGSGDDAEPNTTRPDPNLLDRDAPQPSPSKKRGRPRKPKPGEATNGKAPKGKAGSSSTARNSLSPDIAALRSSSPNDVVVTGHMQGMNGHTSLDRRKTASQASLQGASHHDPIDVEAGKATEAKPGPKKYAFASDTKPAHAFFSRLKQGSTSRATSVASDRTAVADPAAAEPEATPAAALDSELSEPAEKREMSPTRPQSQKSGPTSGNGVHSFFQTKGPTPKPGALKRGWGPGVREGEEWLAPLPGSVWPVHEGGVSEPNHAGPSMPRRHHHPAPIPEDPSFWQSVLACSTEDSPAQATHHRRLKQQTQRDGAHADREGYCERFRPKTAAEVLGNTTEATYLRDWISALSVGINESRGPKVTRRVPKRKQKADDWIVDDIGLFGPIDLIQAEEDEEIPEPYEEPELPLGQRPSTYPPLSTYLANSILLTGPSGSGKSAAVYAAANELGWEVFEVYPGIGKRTAGNLMSLVGDVGKNHMVGKGKEVEDPAQGVHASSAGLKTFFKPSLDDGQDAASTPTIGSQGEPIEVDDDHPDRPVTPPPRLRNSSVNLTPFRDDAKVRQSLILIEEVDILFEEEASFWPAVVSLIAESRRPIVMTCNDIESVAFSSLPLQTVLQFQPPCRSEAIEYLSGLCRKLDVETVGADMAAVDLYERNVVRRSALLQNPLPPNGNEWLPYFDLRRAIMQLQLERGQVIPAVLTVEAISSEELKDLAMQLDRASFVDAHLCHRSWAVMEINELDRYAPSADDLLASTTALVKPELPDEVPALPAYDHTIDIASYLVDPRATAASGSYEELMSDQIHHIRSLLPLLDPVIPLSANLLPHPSLFTDYMPALHNMIQIDDFRSVAYEAAKAAGEDLRNFKTGRPMRMTSWLGKEGFMRHLELDETALEVGRRALQY